MSLSPRSSGHYYTRTGESAHEVPMASDPGKMRPTTIRDARKLNLLPSVTTILKEIAKPFLVSWQLEQAIRAALANPTRLEGETEDAHILRIEREGFKIVDEAGKRGTLIHEAIEKFICYDELTSDPVIRPLIMPYVTWHRDNVEAVYYTEKVCIHRELGFAGRMDLKARLKGRGDAILDYKSRKHGGSDGKLAIYDENGIQLASYREADGVDNPKAEKCITVIIASDTPDVCIHEWPASDVERFFEAFKSLLSYWQLMKKYSPVA